MSSDPVAALAAKAEIGAKFLSWPQINYLRGLEIGCVGIIGGRGDLRGRAVREHDIAAGHQLIGAEKTVFIGVDVVASLPLPVALKRLFVQDLHGSAFHRFAVGACDAADNVGCGQEMHDEIVLGGTDRGPRRRRRPLTGGKGVWIEESRLLSGEHDLTFGNVFELEAAVWTSERAFLDNTVQVNQGVADGFAGEGVHNGAGDGVMKRFDWG